MKTIASRKRGAVDQSTQEEDRLQFLRNLGLENEAQTLSLVPQEVLLWWNMQWLNIYDSELSDADKDSVMILVRERVRALAHPTDEILMIDLKITGVAFFLRGYRTTADLTQQQLAEQTTLSLKSIVCLETGAFKIDDIRHEDLQQFVAECGDESELLVPILWEGLHSSEPPSDFLNRISSARNRERSTE